MAWLIWWKRKKKTTSRRVLESTYGGRQLLLVLFCCIVRFGLTVVSFVTSTSRKLLLMELVALRETPRMGVCRGVKGRVGGWLEFAMIWSFMIDATD